VASFVQQVEAVMFHATMADLPEDRARYPVAVLGANSVLVGAIDAMLDSIPDETPVAQVMAPAPRTIRGALRVDEVVKRLRKDRLDRVFVTTVSGALLGLVSLDDLEEVVRAR
jgi:CBS domain-containing protein